jgi:tetratricopeptide (TPR) repeat protein
MRRSLFAVAGLSLWLGIAPAIVLGTDSQREAQALAQRALVCLQRGEDAVDPDAKRKAYDEGLSLARRAVSLDDDNADAHFAIFGNEGRLMLLDGVTPNPISLLTVNNELERTLEINPNHADALAAKGGLYRQLPWALGGSLNVAEECLTKAIASDPNAVSARIELAATYRDMGQPDRGLPLLDKAVDIAEREGKQRQAAEARTLLSQLQPH